jgi:hypothetical protein
MVALLGRLLQNDTLHTFVGEYSWVWPICEILHFVGMALLFGTVGLLDLRLLGVAKKLPVAPVERVVRWGVGGFALAATTGYFFVVGAPNGPIEELSNLAFQLKMGCLLLAGLNVLVFYTTGISRQVDLLGPGDDAPGSAKAVAAVSLILWIAVIYFGRMIMYADAFYERAYYPF